MRAAVPVEGSTPPISDDITTGSTIEVNAAPCGSAADAGTTSVTAVTEAALPGAEAAAAPAARCEPTSVSNVATVGPAADATSMCGP